MAFRFIILISIFITNISFSNIIYDKNGTIVTEIEVTNYLKIYENTSDAKITKNIAIKNIVLMKQTIKYLLNANSEFMSILDKNILLEYGDEISKNEIIFNFIRFQKIRNEFISEYFEKFFDTKDLEIILSKYDNFKLPISKNNCLTIEKMHVLKKDERLIKKFYDMLKQRGQKQFEIIINSQSYDVCIDDKFLNNIENMVIKFIENETKDEFNRFVYSKTN